MLTSSPRTLTKLALCLLSGIALTLSSPLLRAAPVNVVNPGFEDNSVGNPFNEFTFGAPAGWELYDPNNVTSNGDGPQVYVGTLTPFLDPHGAPGEYVNFPAGALEGQRVSILYNQNGTESLGEYGLYQELSTTLQPFTTYTLDVGVGNIASGTAMNGTPFALDGFPGYRIELQAGGVMLEEDDNTLAGTIPDGEFAISTVSFTTGANHTQLDEHLGILLVNLNEEDPNFPDSDLEVDFDDIRLDASPALAGDFDFSGNVDAHDFLLWQRGFPAIYDQDDLADWQLNYGMSLQGAFIALVPEPTSLSLLFTLCSGSLFRYRFGRT